MKRKRKKPFLSIFRICCFLCLPRLSRANESLFFSMAEDEGLYIFLWVVILVVTSALIFFSVHFLVNLIDLANDFLNPIDMCSVVNKLVVPEYLTHLVLVLCFVVGGYWIEVLINLPMLALNMKRYFEKNICSIQLEFTMTLKRRGKLLLWFSSSKSFLSFGICTVSYMDSSKNFKNNQFTYEK